MEEAQYGRALQGKGPVESQFFMERRAAPLGIATGTTPGQVEATRLITEVNTGSGNRSWT